METTNEKVVIKKISNKTTPLCYLPDDGILCYRLGRLLKIHKGRVSNKIRITTSLKERLWSKSSLLYRFFRLGIRSSAYLNENVLLLCVDGRIKEFNLNTNSISLGWRYENNERPLSFTTVSNIIGFDDGVYFGGYLSNNSKQPVNIYHRIGVDKWHVVYTFSLGVINHVHRIVADPYRNCLWVFTGDFDESSAIWKITNNFKTVERVVCNDQRYRACVAYALPEGLLYATDAPFVDNYIYLLNTSDYSIKKIYPIHGSCIYGCKWKDNYVFSSTVEGDGRNLKLTKWLFTRKLGAGIKDNYVHMYLGNPGNGFKEVYKEQKDGLPLYTFQFGVFKYPTGDNNSDILYFQPVATKENDLYLMSISL